MNDNIQVLVRLRPLLPFQHQPVWIPKNNQLRAQAPKNKQHSPSQHCFNFQRIITQTTNTQQMYKTHIKPALNSALEKACNISVLAYGQTCSGKTHTILGQKQVPGVIPCILRDLFIFKQSHKCLVKMSYLQIYNEKLKDLLQLKKQKQSGLKINQDAKWICQVSGAVKQSLGSFQEGVAVLQKGEMDRQYGQGQHHDRSSRSHTILRIFVELWDSNFSSKCFTISIVDLAGSERLVQAHQSTAQTGFINKSLFQLTNVIQKLSQKAVHVPFRDSKLTRLLEPTLTGTGKCFLVCCASIAKDSFRQTLSTLRLAQRAKLIKLKQEEIDNESSFFNQSDRLRAKLMSKTKQCLQLRGQLQQVYTRLEELQAKLVQIDELKGQSMVHVDVIALMDHQNFTLFLKDSMTEVLSQSSELAQIKQVFVSKMQQLYESYTSQIVKITFGDSFQAKIQEVCFMNMVLEHQKLTSYKLDVIQQLLNQQKETSFSENMKFYQTLSSYKRKLQSLSQTTPNSQIKARQSHSLHTKNSSRFELSQQHFVDSQHSPSVNFAVQKHIQQEFGSQIVVWGCKKDFRVCKGQSQIGFTRINNLGMIRSVVCGYHHTLVLTSQGKLYGWGKNSQKQISSTLKQAISTPTLININEKVTQMAAGWGHSLALTSSGDLYVWGYGQDGQLGLGNKQSVTNPTLLHHQSQKVQVFAGHSHSAFLDNKGDLYTFGFNQDYRLMIGQQKQVFSPRKIPIRDIKHASLGVSHSAVITTSGLLFCGGTGTYGQLGVILNENSPGWQRLQVVDKKFQREAFEKICPLIQSQTFGNKNKAIRVQCGQNVTCVLAQNGQLYSFGKNNAGRSGHTSSIPTVTCKDISSMALKCRHGLAYNPVQNKLYSWGFNMYGQASPSLNGDIQSPQIIQHLPDKKVLSVSCGFFHSAILLK